MSNAVDWLSTSWFNDATTLQAVSESVKWILIARAINALTYVMAILVVRDVSRKQDALVSPSPVLDVQIG